MEKQNEILLICFKILDYLGTKSESNYTFTQKFTHSNIDIDFVSTYVANPQCLISEMNIFSNNENVYKNKMFNFNSQQINLIEGDWLEKLYTQKCEADILEYKKFYENDCDTFNKVDNTM